jgi:hypothetical protein
METFAKLFGSVLVFFYHCFDRIVIHGYLLGLSRPGNVVFYFRDVLGLSPITPEVLARPTREYQAWVEAYARQHRLPFEWAPKGVRKEDFVRPWLQRMERQKRYGVYYILKSKERGNTFRSCLSSFSDSCPQDRLLRRRQSCFTHYYFYLRDETLGPMVVQVASYLPFPMTFYLNGHSFIAQQLRRAGVAFRQQQNAFLRVSNPGALKSAADGLTAPLLRQRLQHWTAQLGPQFPPSVRRAMNLNRFYSLTQVEYCLNFIFRRHFPIHHLFERSCDLGLGRLTAHHLSQIFGFRLTHRLKGFLDSSLRQLEHGHHVFRAACKKAWIKSYEKFSTFLRLEVCSNCLPDFGLRKGLDHLPEVRLTLANLTDRFAAFEASCLNVHGDFPLFQRLALPVLVGQTRIPGIKIHDTRVIRLMEVLLHAGTLPLGWRSAQIHQAVLTTFGLSASAYTLTQLRYDLRKMKAHGLVQRCGQSYAYCLTSKGAKVALLFILFHKRVCGPLAFSLFQRRPDPQARPHSRIEAAYHRADQAIEKVLDLLAA